MFQKVTAIFIFSVLVFGMGGYYAVFKMEQAAIHKDIKKRIKEFVPKEALHLITVSSANEKEVEWERAGKEFRYKDEMYDIVYAEKNEKATDYYCIKDKEETSLLSRFDEIVSNQNTSESRTGKLSGNMFKVFFSLNYYPAQSISIQFFPSDIIAFKTDLLVFYSSGFLTKHLPPPEDIA